MFDLKEKVDNGHERCIVTKYQSKVSHLEFITNIKCMYYKTNFKKIFRHELKIIYKSVRVPQIFSI